MAKKKGGLGRIFGAITGSPYERLLKQVEKLAKENKGDEGKLARHLKKLVQIVSQNFKEENIDEEEHDLIIEAIEEADPKGRSFPKLSEEEDAFYAGDAPAPELKRDKRKNLDDLMTASGKEFVGSYGRDEFDEFKARMTDEFYAESDEAIAAGDHQVLKMILTTSKRSSLKSQALQIQMKRKMMMKAILLMKMALNGLKMKMAIGGIENLAKMIGKPMMNKDSIIYSK